MDIASISHAIQSIGFLTYIRESGYTYPVIMATHLTCIAVFGGLSYNGPPPSWVGVYGHFCD